MTSSNSHADQPIVVEEWPSENPLLVVSVLFAAIGWVLLTVTVIGLVYALFIALFFALMHLVFVGHVRGSAVRLGPNQFPELHAAVERIARRMDLTPLPEIYVMQAGGSLNAFATRFLRLNIVVLFSDLLEACGANTAARDMIIAHELGHIKAGHLRWRWFLMPSGFVPFLGPALSRAREYTCDRYGLAGANGDREAAGIGLAILAAGATHGPRVNRAELVRQRATITRSGLMTFAEWFGSHPPLCKRIAEIDPSLAAGAPVSRSGPALAAAFTLAVPTAMVFAVIGFMGSDIVAKFRAIADSAAVQQAGAPAAEEEEPEHVVPPDAEQRARGDITRLVAFIEQERRRASLPWNAAELGRRLREEYPRGDMPADPFDGSDYGYDQRGTHYMVWSSGPDGRSWTDDDIRYDSRVGRIVSAPQLPALKLP
jgi:Zn-dependent protease with chaperone function